MPQCRIHIITMLLDASSVIRPDPEYHIYISTISVFNIGIGELNPSTRIKRFNLDPLNIFFNLDYGLIDLPLGTRARREFSVRGRYRGKVITIARNTAVDT